MTDTRTDLTPEQAYISRLAADLITALETVVPRTTMHYAVTDLQTIDLPRLVRLAGEIVCTPGTAPEPVAPEPFTASDVAHASEVIAATYSNAYVMRWDDERGAVRYAQAFNLVTADGGHTVGRDVRTVYLRVLVEGITEELWPVADLMTEVGNGSFAVTTADRYHNRNRDQA